MCNLRLLRRRESPKDQRLRGKDASAGHDVCDNKNHQTFRAQLETPNGVAIIDRSVGKPGKVCVDPWREPGYGDCVLYKTVQ